MFITNNIDNHENIEKYLTYTHNHQMDQDHLHIQKFMNQI